MAMTSALAFMLATSPGSCHVRPKWQTAERHPQVDQMLQQVRRHQQCVLQAPSVGDTGCWHLLTGLRATLSVCMEEDCLQQGAPQTLAKFRKNAAKRRDVTVYCGGGGNLVPGSVYFFPVFCFSPQEIYLGYTDITLPCCDM